MHPTVLINWDSADESKMMMYVKYSFSKISAMFRIGTGNVFGWAFINGVNILNV